MQLLRQEHSKVYTVFSKGFYGKVSVNGTGLNSLTTIGQGRRKQSADGQAQRWVVKLLTSHARSARQNFRNATMYREAGARRGVHFNPECPHSVLPTVERGLKSESKN